MQKQELNEKLITLINGEFISPYRLAKIEAILRNKPELPPQKIYGYIRQGYIKATLNDLGKMQVSKEESIRYLTKTLKRNS